MIKGILVFMLLIGYCTSQDLAIYQFEDGYIYTMDTQEPLYAYSLMRGEGVQIIKGDELFYFLIDYNTCEDNLEVLYKRYKDER